MTVFALDQVTAVARSTGLTGDALATAVAIAGWSGSPVPGESGGKSDAVGDTTLQNGKWGPSIGLWQVRSLNAELNTGGTRDRSQLSDPAFNARSMYQISSGGTNWRPWSVYTAGIYLANMSAAKKAADGDTTGVTVPSAPKLAAGLPNLNPGSLWPSSAMWARIGWAAIGLLVALLGALILARSTSSALLKPLAESKMAQSVPKEVG